MLEYALARWDKNAMLVLCDENALKIQKAFRLFIAHKKLNKLKNNSDNYRSEDQIYFSIN